MERAIPSQFQILHCLVHGHENEAMPIKEYSLEMRRGPAPNICQTQSLPSRTHDWDGRRRAGRSCTARASGPMGVSRAARLGRRWCVQQAAAAEQSSHRWMAARSSEDVDILYADGITSSDGLASTEFLTRCNF